jgi:hypothetical protein
VKVKGAKILHRLNAQHGEETLPHESTYELHNKFSEDHKQVSNLPHAYDQPTDVCDANIHSVEELFWETGEMKCVILYPAMEKCWKC